MKCTHSSSLKFHITEYYHILLQSAYGKPPSCINNIIQFFCKIGTCILNGAKENRNEKWKLFCFGYFSAYMTLYPYILVKCLMCDFVLSLFHSPFLTWRDVQHIIVRTSRAGHLNANDWKTNAAGYKGESFLSSLLSQAI